MKITLSTEQAISILLEDQYTHWSYEGARALICNLQDLEEEIGEEFELDRTALRGDYTEYESLVAFAEDRAADMSEAPEDEDERDEYIREYIHEHGTLIEFDGGIIVSCF